MSGSPETHAWWGSLRHGGFLLDEQRLRAHFPNTLDHQPSTWAVEQLRGALTDFSSEPEDTANRTRLLTALLEHICGLDHNSGGTWNRKPDATWTYRSVTGEAIRPAHVWEGSDGRRLLVFTTPEKRLGVGHGRRAVARVLEWLRARNEPLAVLSNGHQVRLIWCGADTFAWCESDSALWLMEGAPGAQLEALRILLSPTALTPVEDKTGRTLSPLLRGILDSRKGQAELSAMLGERVRLAVERLIQSHGSFLNALSNPPSTSDTYVAACRVVMRLVFSFFAESRELLPRSLPIYHQSYSLAGLLTDLDRAAGSSRGERLAHRYGAWPRLLALFRLIHDGSEHEALPLIAYGGTLFASGDKDSVDGIRRALWVFENACFDAAHPTMPDREVWEILRLITKTTVAVRQGTGWTKLTVPVDFSDLSSEYIGILYEGLLDYELRSVSETEGAVIFLAVGNEPALPLARLEAMEDSSLKGLFEAFKKAAKAESDSEDEDEEQDETSDESAGEDFSPDSAPASEGTEPDILADSSDLPAREVAQQRAIAWAKKAATLAGIVKKPRSKGGAAALEFERNLDTAARGLIRRLVLPGEWYVVRWGGTRKGAGTFYTRPGLSLPTIRRTLEPLAYSRDADGKLTPKTPEAILALKVCDSACGSGTFPVGALRYLADALFASVFHHRWMERVEERQADGSLQEVIRPIEKRGDKHPLLQRARDEVAFRNVLHDEDSLRGFLKRLVVENCLYGVDFDPLAIELARLALWVETMDRRLPFGFLDHKFRCGNGLVGAWLDTFQHYPIMAWMRDGGDSAFENFVHHCREKQITRGKKAGTVEQVGDVWTHCIVKHLDDVVRPALRTYIEETTTPVFSLLAAFHEPNRLLDEARESFATIHASLTNPTEQQQKFEAWLRSDQYQNLRAALDLWCALWFWPADQLHISPTPLTFAQPTPEMLKLVAALRRDLRFFHWELEFPDVFTTARPGFDAVLGNPPWEIQKPNSKEWFSNVDPLYRTYGKTQAVAKQTALFRADRDVEKNWLAYNARLKALSNFTKFAAFAFGDPKAHENDAFHFTIVPRHAEENEALHDRWRPKRARLTGFADPAHPFRYQGSADINTYKLFAEQSLALLRPAGRLGLILPSGIYSDKGSASLRGVLLDKCSWEWCFGFHNRDGIFDIHRDTKFTATIVEKGGKTAAVRTAFMRRNIEDWTSAEAIALSYPRDRVEQFSPFSKAFVEVHSSRDVALLTSIYSRGVLLGDESARGWGISYRREFDMTGAAKKKKFEPLPKWVERGYRPDEYGHWLKGRWQAVGELRVPGAESEKWQESHYFRDSSVVKRPGLILSHDGKDAIRTEDISGAAVPLYQGGMIWQFDFAYSAYGGGSGNRIDWQHLPWSDKYIHGQFLMGCEHLVNRPTRSRVGFRDVQNATNQRTTLGVVLPGFPCGNKVPILDTADADPIWRSLVITGFDSFPVDRIMRNRMGQNTLNWFYLEELPLPARTILASLKPLARCAASLSYCSPLFSGDWLFLRQKLGLNGGWFKNWAITDHERLRLRCILDASVAYAFGLSLDDYSWILKDCDHPINQFKTDGFSSRLDPKGFWRVDKECEPELRHTVLAQVAFADLQSQGIDSFLAGGEGEGWQLPEGLRLADYGLGHDARAQNPQPVAARLGPRFLHWQLEKDPADSWAECEAHAAQLDALWRHARNLNVKLEGDIVEASSTAMEMRETSSRPASPNKQSQLPLL